MSSSITVISNDVNLSIKAYVSYMITTIELLAKTQDFITIALSGGSLIEQLSNELIKQKDSITPFSHKLKFILADERFVPLDHADSTYAGYTRQCPNIFTHLNIPAENVYPIKADAESVEACALDYQQRILPLLNDQQGFDILSLGMGPDGHCCSLFPGHQLFTEPQSRIVVPISDSPKPPPCRVTLTLKCLNNSKYVMFFVSGEGKAEVIKRILVDKDQSLPSAAVNPTNGTLKWFLDQSAAKLL